MNNSLCNYFPDDYNCLSEKQKEKYNCYSKLLHPINPPIFKKSAILEDFDEVKASLIDYIFPHLLLLEEEYYEHTNNTREL